MIFVFRSLPAFLFIALSACTVKGLAADPSWEPWMETGKDVFPSLLVATATVDWNELMEEEEDAGYDQKKDQAKTEKEEAGTEEKTGRPEEEHSGTEEHLGDPNSWFGVTLSAVPKGARIAVELSGESWLRPSRIEVMAEKDLAEVTVTPRLIYDYEVLRGWLEQRPVNLTFRVSIDGKDLGEKTETLLMHRLQDCPVTVEDEEQEPVTDLTWMFAAYVNENHPAIDPLLKEALDTGLTPAFEGYLGEGAEAVNTQVFSLWHVLQRRGIRYSDVSVSTGARLVASQNVRFIEETLAAGQANCVDGTVLMASLLRRIGLNVYLVILPDHCLLAYDLDAEGKKQAVLETTGLDRARVSPPGEAAKLSVKARAGQMKESRRSFREALEEGGREMEAVRRQLDDPDDLDHELVSVEEARDWGLMPLTPLWKTLPGPPQGPGEKRENP